MLDAVVAEQSISILSDERVSAKLRVTGKSAYESSLTQKIAYIYVYIYIYNRIEQCTLPVTTIMALWQLVNLGRRCTVTHCRIAMWIHQSAQTASSERCIMQIVNVSLRDSPPNP